MVRRNPGRAARDRPLLTDEQRRAILEASDTSDDDAWHSDSESEQGSDDETGSKESGSESDDESDDMSEGTD
jgi:hypothetical protein